MRGLKWSSRGRKSSSTSEERQNHSSSRRVSHSSNSSQEVRTRESSPSATHRTLKNNRQMTHASIFISDNNRSNRSLASSRDSSTADESKTDDSSSQFNPSDDNSTISSSKTSIGRRSSVSISVSTPLTPENYDSNVFKSGWVNRAHGSLSANNRDSRIYGGGSTTTDNQQHKNTLDYKLYKAELQGCLLNLYKSGIGNVKFFDPTLPAPAHLLGNPKTPKSQSETSTQKLIEPETKIVETKLKHLSELYPHPDLNLDKDGKLLSGSPEALCHMVLFFPPLNSNETRKILDVLLMLPLIDRFEKFLQIFNLFGMTFTKHKTKLFSIALQHYQVNPKIDALMTERLALVIKTILDVFPGFLLDDNLFPLIVNLLDTISLHNDEISSNLKISIVETQNKLNHLVAFSKMDTASSEIDCLTGIDNFMNLEIEVLAEQVHKINMKFMREWSPQMDYSLLYESKFNEKHIYLNPMVFKNSTNVHYLGRLLVSHLFSSKLKKSPNKRAEILSKWVHLGCKFEKLGDMVSWLAVATIVCSIPVLRLGTTWKFVEDSVLKLIFKDWVPTIVQLDRRRMSSKSTNSVFILAPPNLDDTFIRANVIPYFGDLAINANDLPADTKFKYLEKKIHRTKNAFYKWQQRLEQASKNDSGESKFALTDTNTSEANSLHLYDYLKFHLEQEHMNIEKIMDLSLQLEPPRVNQKKYCTTVLQRSSLLTGSYLPVLFNDLFPNYSLFPKDSLIGAAGVFNSRSSSDSISETSSHDSKLLSISSPVSPINITDIKDKNSITGIDDIDETAARELSSKLSNKQKLLKSIRDAFNIDMDLFHVSDDITFKSVFDIDGKSRPASVVIETHTRVSQNSSINSLRDSQDLTRLSSNLENLDFFNVIGKSTSAMNDPTIRVVLKSATLDRLFDLLVLTTSIFSKLVDTKDFERYFNHEKKRLLARKQGKENTSMGPLDYAFIKLTMDNDVFTDTFFKTYKSFTTTTAVLENLAKRFIGAMSCAVSISRLINSGKRKSPDGITENRFSGLFDVLNSSNFPAWDLKITHQDELNLLYVAKIQMGAMEALLHLVGLHYADFTDSLVNNTTFLDILKIMDQEVNEEWTKRLRVAQETKFSRPEYQDQAKELESLHTILKELFKKIKTSYQRQLYRPLAVSAVERLIQRELEKCTTRSLYDMNQLVKDQHLDDELVLSFHELTFDNYSGIAEWVYNLDELVSTKMALISTQDWVDVSQLLELYSNESLVSFFQYPLHTYSYHMLSTGENRLDEFEISDIFKWLTSLLLENRKPLFDRLPPSVQLVINFHMSLSKFFVLEIAHLDKTFTSRVNHCAVILQILNFVRWKNSSMDLFHDNKLDRDSTVISPHVPSFIETSVVTALVCPESRYFEMFWKLAYKDLAEPDSPELKDISNILMGIENQIKFFVEFDGLQMAKPNNLCPCPGWLIRRLLEISEMVPNMSIENSKMINFDKRRFVNNIIVNFKDMLPSLNGSDEAVLISIIENQSKSILSYHVLDIGKRKFRKRCKEVASKEAKRKKFHTVGLFNNLLLAEVDKVKRDQKKKEQLLSQETEYKRTDTIERITKSRNRLSSSPSLLSINTSNSKSTFSSSDNTNRSKRSSVAVSSSRNSILSNSTHGNGSMGRKLGGFFKRPFSIGGFSTSASSHSLNSILLNGVQANGSVSPLELPDVGSSVFKEVKPLITIKTFEIKSCVPVMGYNKLFYLANCFKIVMENGNEHLIQAASSNDMFEWLKVITLSKRYSFHSQKFKGKTSNKIFGVPIEDVCEREGGIVPNIVVKLLEEIELRGLDEMGLYRVPGSVGSINALKNAFDEEGAVSNSFTLEDDRWFEINTIAGCFKLYLRELPESLFTTEKLPQFVDLTLRLNSNEIEYDSFKAEMAEMLRSLPVYNFHMMRRIFEHLKRVDEHVDNNRMDATNLAIVFSMSFIDQDDLAASMGPTLGALQTTLKLFIKKPGDFF
ncbi:LAFE_0H10726g1_1 [Lachancea fermentati]|uniref:LAFE_0H10726g1_1 n=1 Tax=Lachancea fermentati TaxID=4955 RepID=A0A1G4MKA5_LACFM|nr:LAFE_0H10726g1_1 [Lachancea fermentati]